MINKKLTGSKGSLQLEAAPEQIVDVGFNGNKAGLGRVIVLVKVRANLLQQLHDF